MKLSVEQLREIAWGAVRVCEEDGGVAFHRFTEAQEELYRKTNPEFYRKSLAPAGVRLVFRTNSRKLTIRAEITTATKRTYYCFDVFVDGKPVGYLNNYADAEIPDGYTDLKLPFGNAAGSFDLGEGEKTVVVYLPWGLRAVLEEVSLDDGAWIEAVKREKRILIFGDSITQGYDALQTSMRYAGKLADSLDAEEFNKAIGGEVFFPELAALKDAFEPDYISVAYGTNDWGKVTAEEFNRDCEAFYKNLSANYPEAKIFALTPIWRKDLRDFEERGSFERIAKRIREVAAELPNVTVIDCFGFVPEDEAYFADLRLHPNDKGFVEYHKSLWEAIEKTL